MIARLRRWWWLVLPVAILVWANWQAPEMHHYMQPADSVIWQLAPLESPDAARTLETRLSAQPGVAACSVSPRTSCIALVYHPDEATPDDLYRAIGQSGFRVITNPPVQTSTARQCPVPAGYFVFLDKVRFALNLRRLFVSV
ncbi:hypothetical protein ACVWYF_003742 [Hymenobacter sp. UYAg731]